VLFSTYVVIIVGCSDHSAPSDWLDNWLDNDPSNMFGGDNVEGDHEMVRSPPASETESVSGVREDSDEGDLGMVFRQPRSDAKSDSEDSDHESSVEELYLETQLTQVRALEKAEADKQAKARTLEEAAVRRLAALTIHKDKKLGPYSMLEGPPSPPDEESYAVHRAVLESCKALRVVEQPAAAAIPARSSGINLSTKQISRWRRKPK
jgi:hypothetical protein